MNTSNTQSSPGGGTFDLLEASPEGHNVMDRVKRERLIQCGILVPAPVGARNPLATARYHFYEKLRSTLPVYSKGIFLIDPP